MPANKHRLIDTEDTRLTAGERRILRQIALRLRNGPAAQPVREVVTVDCHRQTDLEEEIAALFPALTKQQI